MNDRHSIKLGRNGISTYKGIGWTPILGATRQDSDGKNSQIFGVNGWEDAAVLDLIDLKDTTETKDIIANHHGVLKRLLLNEPKMYKESLIYLRINALIKKGDFNMMDFLLHSMARNDAKNGFDGELMDLMDILDKNGKTKR